MYPVFDRRRIERIREDADSFDASCVDASVADVIDDHDAEIVRFGKKTKNKKTYHSGLEKTIQARRTKIEPVT